MFRGHTEATTSVSWSPDGSRIATASRDNTARVWDSRSGTEVLALKGHTESVSSASWSPDGSRIATASDDNTARVWDARNGSEVLALKGHTEPVTSASWSPDGSRIATASYDKTSRIWDCAGRYGGARAQGAYWLRGLRVLEPRRLAHRHREQ